MTALMDRCPNTGFAPPSSDWASTPGIRTMHPIDVNTLGQRAGLMTRRDRKYLVDLSLVPTLVDRLHADALVLEIDGRRQFGYESCYFDTPDLIAYLLAARRRPRRFKVRTRTYLDSDTRWLEVKVRDGRGRTRKSRIPWTAQCRGRLGAAGAAFVAAQLVGTVKDPEPVVAHLAPTLTTQYLRSTLYLPDDAARLTIDESLEAWDVRGNGVVAPGLAIVETKGAGPACAADRILWSLGQRPIRVSKYATSLARMHPDLPATTWRPALRRLAEPRIPGSLPPDPRILTPYP
jgi:hypothetical protein